MTGFWPDHLLKELIDRRGMLVLGSGLSRTCTDAAKQKRMPTWRDLIFELAASLPPSDRGEIERLVDGGRMLDAAQILIDLVSGSDLKNYIRRTFLDQAIRPSNLYEAVNLIDQPIVLTLNYDRLYEMYWEQLVPETLPLDGGSAVMPLAVSRYDEADAIDHVRSERRLLMKLHGCASKPEGIVFSKSQYANAKYSYPNYFRLVSALMLTRTMLFVGCGFSGDPDVDLLLEDAAFLTQSDLPHYALLPEGQHFTRIKSIRSIYNVQVLEYDNSDGTHSGLAPRLQELAQLVNDART